MREEFVELLVCPKCNTGLTLSETERDEDNRIKSGMLECPNCRSNYPIIQYIPRFVSLDNYANNFGLEWTNHARTQYDDYSGSNVSEKRFFEETKWARDLTGQTILEVGSGSGRFTAQAASTGALVVSADYSYAVDVNHKFNGKKNNVFIIQADIYNLPLRENYFDKLLCIGVLQHTPDPKRAFLSLPHYLKKDGEMVVDVYKVINGIVGLFQTKYWVRPITKRLNPKMLYGMLNAYVRFMWPICRLIRKLPYGRQLNRVLLIADYGGVYDLSDEMLKEWAILDTFDMLSPTYDSPQTLDTVNKWFNEAHLKNIEVNYGYNGIEGRGKKP